MKIDVKKLLVAHGEKLDLAKRPTLVDPLYASKDDSHATLAAHVKELAKLQQRFYAAACRGLLIVLQGMDTSGKDSAIAHVMSGVNPQGCNVSSFKTPTPRELRHDFLWRAQSDLPERGMISVFNRSYYEDVLILRVHPKLLQAEGLEPVKDLDALWRERYHSIREFERHLVANSTHVVKIFLHISKDEQKRRLLARLDDPEKTWKAATSDVEERAYSKDYRRAYEHALSETSVHTAPWYVVPADDKLNARLFISQIVIDAMASMPIEPPTLDAGRKRELKTIRKKLDQE